MTIEQPVRGGDAALFQITLITCLHWRFIGATQPRRPHHFPVTSFRHHSTISDSDSAHAVSSAGIRAANLGLVLLALGMFDSQVSSRLLDDDVISLPQVLFLVVQRVQLTVSRPQLLRQPAATR